MSERFMVQNIKCGGCADTIQKGLKTLDGVTGVTVDIPSGQVDVSGTALNRALLASTLVALGYPERAAS